MILLYLTANSTPYSIIYRFYPYNVFTLLLSGMITFYLKSRCSENDIAAIVSYLATITDLELLTEAIEIVKHMIETPGDNQSRLFQMLAGKMAQQMLLKTFPITYNNTSKLIY